ncbi:sensor histidine kinase [Aestuariibacter sp. GS-14]|uniref:sensor histidine kinase n=1 Tax=Aestuariibacter sp. GS-14 TaxID=2590670 RepID=UPI0015E82E33|nr:sensor histidine kinase [Aestuariibacter sp. GS-14]
MLASNRITLTVVMIFTGVFSLLSVVMFLQANADIQKEARAAFEQAKVLADSEIPYETLQLLLQNNRDVVLLNTPSPAFESSQISPLLDFNASLPPLEITHRQSGKSFWIAANTDAELSEISATVIQVLGIFFIALVVTLLSLRYAVNSRLKPLAKLCEGLNSMTTGKYQFNGDATDIAEIQTLIDHYNSLTSNLQAKENQVVSLRKRVAAIQEQERQSLARELHDNLGQLITGITVQTYMLSQQRAHPEYVAKACEQIQQQCREVHQGMKEVTSQLYPVFLTRLGLIRSIQQATQTWQDIHNVNVNWQDECHPFEAHPERDTQVYRIVQEALNNIAKHAHANQVDISLTTDTHQLQILIRDNGKGFSPDTAPGGLGLESMQERATLANGTLTIHSSDTGTHISLSVPVTFNKELNHAYIAR